MTGLDENNFALLVATYEKVLEKSCAELKTAVAALTENFSDDRLRGKVKSLTHILRGAAHHEVDPHYLELEILESSVLSDISQVTATMNASHGKGVRFALDDFGTGYSSLTHLRRMPAYLIKIYQSFVRDMLEDADDLAIVEGVAGLARAPHREVIAKDVETIAHGAALLQLGSELAQCYGIARAMPGDDIHEWSPSWKPDDSWQVKCRLKPTNFGHQA